MLRKHSAYSTCGRMFQFVFFLRFLFPLQTACSHVFTFLFELLIAFNSRVQTPSPASPLLPCNLSFSPDSHTFTPVVCFAEANFYSFTFRAPLQLLLHLFSLHSAPSSANIIHGGSCLTSSEIRSEP